MTDKDREAAFQLQLVSTVPYFDAVREAGDLPWFAEGHPRRAEAVARLGLADGHLGAGAQACRLHGPVHPAITTPGDVCVSTDPRTPQYLEEIPA